MKKDLTYAQKEKKRRRYLRWLNIATIILVILLVGSMVGIVKNGKAYFESRSKLTCANYYILDADDSNKLMQLCHDENCTTYFTDRINYDMGKVEECLK